MTLVNISLWNVKTENERWGKWSLVRGEVCLQEHLFEHFNSEQDNEFLHDISVTLINKIDAKKPITREHYWQHTLKRLAPCGLNVEDHCVFIFYWYHVLTDLLLLLYYCNFGYCNCNSVIAVAAVVIVPYEE